MVATSDTSATPSDTLFSKLRLPWPTLPTDGPSNPFSEDSEEISRARTAPIEATKALHNLAFCVTSRSRKNVPLQEAIRFHDLSSKTGLSQALLPRFLRMTIANFYFAEPEPGLVAHSAFSKPLATDKKMRACIWLRHAEMLPAVSKLVNMVKRHPEDMVKFGQFIDDSSGGSSADSAESISRAYPWETLLKGALVVDGRLDFVPHNFFNPQPESARGAAVNFMRDILHNCSDYYCKRILKPIAEAMGKESRIVNCDTVLPQPSSVPKSQDAMTTALDLTMLSIKLAVTNVVGKPRMRMDSLVEIGLSG
ncbi:S-adenosyl-L-methionine-dependent methyltransferase [Sordaria brevicollis]|uniref:S-adenosyl-L-methionine-dependent methyltransferase n=1 Tax=Sordaria brevicollis TaxID=83679 RepID=A0AAE0UE95_SORBR|nr:S-adenosyl-L-methionine-dependent methyltransferase [Sordaria brevicollis]